MTVNELSSLAGITRQWLNKQVRLGQVPDVERGRNGRLQIKDTPKLRHWAEEMSRRPTKYLGHRTALAQRIDRSLVNPKTDCTTGDLAKKLSVSQRQVLRIVPEIPGAYGYTNRYRFAAGPELDAWIKDRIETRDEKYRVESSGMMKNGMTEIWLVLINSATRMKKLLRADGREVKQWSKADRIATFDKLSPFLALAEALNKTL